MFLFEVSREGSIAAVGRGGSDGWARADALAPLAPPGLDALAEDLRLLLLLGMEARDLRRFHGFHGEELL
jgi:hypothetical protein